MILTFEGANKEQEALWREALQNLRNLPFAAINIHEKVKFVGSLGVVNQESTPFAETIWTYDADEGEIKVRNDAPGFGELDEGLIAEARGMGLTYNARLHFHETAAHETGHALFAAMKHKFRLQIAELFGAESDSQSVLQPVGKEWKDRIGEAIAETFKEAFLAAVFRVFPNRTNIYLDYSLYPLFRRLFREGIEQIGSEEFKEVGQTKRLLTEKTQDSWDYISLIRFDKGMPFPADQATLDLIGAEQGDLYTLGEERVKEPYSIHHYIGLEANEANLKAQDVYFGAGQEGLMVTITLDEITVPGQGASWKFRGYYEMLANQLAVGPYEPPSFPWTYPAGAPVGQTINMALEGDSRLVWKDAAGEIRFTNFRHLDPEELNTFQCKQVFGLTAEEWNENRKTHHTPYPKDPDLYWHYGKPGIWEHEIWQDAVHDLADRIEGRRPTQDSRLVGVLCHFTIPVVPLPLEFLGRGGPGGTDFFHPEMKHTFAWPNEGVSGGLTIEIEVPGFTLVSQKLTVPFGRAEAQGQTSGSVRSRGRVQGHRA